LWITAIRETSGVPGTHEDTAFCHLQDPGSTKKIITSSTPRESARGACTDQGVLDRQNILIELGSWGGHRIQWEKGFIA